MFHVVEFNKSSGGGLGIVREAWLTPRKKECFWPPFKHADKFNKCLTSGQHPTDDWTLFPIDRIFYSTEDVLKAREKLKAAESDSELITEEDEHSIKRKRKPNKKFDYSHEEISTDEEIQTTSKCALKVPKLSESLISPANQKESSEIAFELEEDFSTSNFSGYLSEASQHTTPVSRPSGSLRKASHQESDAFNNIARILAKFERRLSEIEKTQREILVKLSPGPTAFIELPPELKLPCESVEEVSKLEEWLTNDDNVKALVVNLSVLGGKKTANTVRKILDKLFSNQVAVFYNWTGKHNKCALKDLAITKIIPGIVRRNRLTATATDDEVNLIIANWFRFCKDRDGGRHVRTNNTK